MDNDNSDEFQIASQAADYDENAAAEALKGLCISYQEAESTVTLDGYTVQTYKDLESPPLPPWRQGETLEGLAAAIAQSDASGTPVEASRDAEVLEGPSFGQTFVTGDPLCDTLGGMASWDAMSSAWSSASASAAQAYDYWTAMSTVATSSMPAFSEVRFSDKRHCTSRSNCLSHGRHSQAPYIFVVECTGVC